MTDNTKASVSCIEVYPFAKRKYLRIMDILVPKSIKIYKRLVLCGSLYQILVGIKLQIWAKNCAFDRLRLNSH